MLQLVQEIESALQSTLEHVFIVYHNPVWGSLWDASPAMRRWSAGTIAFAEGDLDLWDDEYDCVVIWQKVQGARQGAYPEAGRDIVLVNPDRADLAPLSNPLDWAVQLFPACSSVGGLQVRGTRRRGPTARQEYSLP
jgi:hypothetical protein